MEAINVTDLGRRGKIGAVVKVQRYRHSQID